MKYLDKINSPKDLKNIPKDELGKVCEELRTYITETINQIGGHLAPTLGAIEITTAVHYVFDAPKDKIVWDTGHQAYAHKVLTGRYNQFPTIRRYKGLSGFLKRSESEYDVFGAGHVAPTRRYAKKTPTRISQGEHQSGRDVVVGSRGSRFDPVNGISGLSSARSKHSNKI